MYAGHSEYGGRILFPESIKEAKDSYLKQIDEELKDKNYFLLEEKLKEYIQEKIKITKCELKKGTCFYRARPGYQGKVIEEAFINYSYKYIPFKDKSLGAPPISLIKEGRFNRNGVSYLYLATDIETAISEMRPYSSDKITVGKFKSKENLIIADFDLAFFKMLDNDIELKKIYPT